MNLVNYQQLAADQAKQLWITETVQQLNTPAFWLQARHQVQLAQLPQLTELEHRWQSIGSLAHLTPIELVNLLAEPRDETITAALLANMLERLRGYADHHNPAGADSVWEMAQALSDLHLINAPVLPPLKNLTTVLAHQFVEAINLHGERTHHQQLKACRWFQPDQYYTVTQYGLCQVLLPQCFATYIPFGGNRWWSRWLFWTRHHVIRQFAAAQHVFLALRQFASLPQNLNLTELTQHQVLERLVLAQTKLTELQVYYTERTTWLFNWYHNIDQKLAQYCHSARAQLLTRQLQILSSLNQQLIQQRHQPETMDLIKALQPKISDLLNSIRQTCQALGNQAQAQAFSRLEKAMLAHASRESSLQDLFYPALELIARAEKLPDWLYPKIYQQINLARVQASIEELSGKPPSEVQLEVRRFDQAWLAGFGQIKQDLQAVLLSQGAACPQLLTVCCARLDKLNSLGSENQQQQIQKLLIFSINKLFAKHFKQPFPDLELRLNFLKNLAKGQLHNLLIESELLPQLQAYCQVQHALKRFHKITQKADALTEHWLASLDRVSQQIWHHFTLRDISQPHSVSEHAVLAQASAAISIKLFLTINQQIKQHQASLSPDTAVSAYLAVKKLFQQLQQQREGQPHESIQTIQSRTPSAD